MLTVGALAPDFALPDAQGQILRLSDLRGKPVVIFFYPKDNTTGCTIEACTFRDAYEEFVTAGAEVIGISSDSSASHAGFASKHRLPYHLLSDAEGTARQAFGIPKTLGLMPGRATFVVDGAGVIQHAFNSQFAPHKHVTEAIGVIRRLQSAGSPA